MTTLQDLVTQRETLDKQISELQKVEAANAIKQAQQLIKLYGLTEQDIFGNIRVAVKEKKQKSDVEAKYRDPATGKEWTGRGLAPKWIRDQERTQFLIVPQATPEETATA